MFAISLDSRGNGSHVIESKVQHHVYSAFGELVNILDQNGVVVTAAPILAPFFTYTGREYDRESSLYHYRKRTYDASIGRFLQSDPFSGVRASPISINTKYAYAWNNPIKFSDPSGETPLLGHLNFNDEGSYLFNSGKYCGANRQAYPYKDENGNTINGANQPDSYSDLRCVKHDLELSEARDYRKGFAHLMYHNAATDFEFYADKVYNPNSWRRNGKFHVGQFLRSQAESQAMLIILPLRLVKDFVLRGILRGFGLFD